jgi:hypothetical protein
VVFDQVCLINFHVGFLAKGKKIAELLSKEQGMRITHVKIKEAQLAEGIARFMSEEYAKMLAGLDTMIRKGGEGRGNEVVFEATGRSQKVEGISGPGGRRKGPGRENRTEKSKVMKVGKKKGGKKKEGGNNEEM